MDLEKELRNVFIKMEPEFPAYNELNDIEDKLFIRRGILYLYSYDLGSMHIVNLNIWNDIKESYKKSWIYAVIESNIRNKKLEEILTED